MDACPIGAAFTSKWRAACGDMADPDLWKRTVAHSALRRLATNAHKRILDLQELASDVEVERDLVAADLQIAALEELLKQSPSPERHVPICAERRASNGRKYVALPAAPPLGPMPDGTFRSTVDCWNRKRDRKWVEKKLGIAEQGNSTTVFVNELDTSVVIAVGYRRVLYGDHGPYVEFTKSQIHWESFPVIKPDKPLHAYYDERFTEDQHVMAYEQRKTVRDKPNPPPGPWSANHNRVETGYADYQPGYVYVSADCLDVLPQDSCSPDRPVKRRKRCDAVIDGVLVLRRLGDLLCDKKILAYGVSVF